MADAITIRANGYHEMAAAEGVAIWWESEGRKAQRLNGTEDLERMLELAGLDWEYEPRPVRYGVINEQGQRIAKAFPGRVILVRSDTQQGLSDVSTRFQIRQPREIVGFFDSLIKAGGFKMNSLGSLHGGVKVWAQASIADAEIVPGDVQQSHLLLADACDGSMKTIATFVNTSVVCANTLGFALGEKGARSVQVSHRSVFDAKDVKAQLGLAVGAFDLFIKRAREMARFDISPEDQRLFFATLLGADYSLEAVTGPNRNKVAVENDKITEGAKFQSFMASLSDAGGALLKGREGTLWGTVNAVTHAIDHKSRARSADNRIDSALFGTGADLKAAAFDKALAMLTAA